MSSQDVLWPPFLEPLTVSCSVPQNQNPVALNCPHLCLGQDIQGAEGPAVYPGPPQPKVSPP